SRSRFTRAPRKCHGDRQQATLMSSSIASPLDDTARTRIIRQEIRKLGDRARQRHPWLARQDAIGAGLFLVSAAAIVANAVLYGTGRLSALLVVPISAFWMSILHELEHDLIHRLYFRGNK